MSKSKRSKCGHGQLNEEDVINYVNEYFDVFRSNLEENHFGKMNTRMPELIIDKFSKLFELWNENLVLANSIQEKRFKDVYLSMANAFDDDSSESSSVSSVSSLILECVHCGGTVTWRNKDVRYSYQCHKTTPEHLEFVQQLNVERTTVSSDTDTSDDSEDDSQVGKYDQFFIYSRCNLCYVPLPTSIVDVNSVQEKNFVTDVVISHLRGPVHRQRMKTFRNNEKYLALENFRENSFKCLVCDEILYLDRMISHCKNDQHKMKIADYEYSEANETRLFDEFAKCLACRNKFLPKSKKDNDGTIFMREFDKECLVFAEGTIRCRLCFCKLITSYCFISHMNGAPHRKAVKTLGVNVHHVKRIDADNLRCTVCDTNVPTLGQYVTHCRKAGHQDKLKKFSDNAEQPSEKKTDDETLVDVSVAKYKCPICLNFAIGAKGLYIHLHTKHPYVCLE